MRGATIIAALAAVCTMAWLPHVSPLSAQQWSADARMGRLDLRLDPGTPTTTSMGVGVSRRSADGWASFSAGVPLADEDPIWGAIDLGQRLTVAEAGPLEIGLDMAGQGFLQRYGQSLSDERGPGGIFDPIPDGGASHGWGVATQVLPFVGLGSGVARLEARAGLSSYRTALSGHSGRRDLILADTRLTFTPTPALAVAAEARHYAAEEQDWTFAGIRALLALQPMDLWGSVGHWFDEPAGTVPWAAGAALPLSSRLELNVEARQDALDPLYGSAPRRSWSAGLRLALTEPTPPAAPVPAAYTGGRATIALPATAADRPRVGGSFNDWQPEPMERDGDRWTWTAPLEPGVYEYAFMTADGEWFVPESTPGRKDDGMGGTVALLVVEDPGS